MVQRAQLTFERAKHLENSDPEIALAYAAICERFEEYETGLAIALSQFSFNPRP